ncbi:MAG: MBL fold metallo-hydrolase [Pseudomonadota bacterium]|nr:MBL fold metallo-hydrolase [Pseudomonadota bacterium]
MLKWKIGDTTITQVLEICDGSGSLPLLPDATPEALKEIEWLEPNFVTKEGYLILNIQMLIIETPSRKMVVDTCIGNDKNLNMEGWANLQLPFLEDLENLGHDVASVDTVICTHLHVDHVGWNTRKVGNRWVPTFPNARYLMVEKEYEFWRDLEEDPFGDVFGESVAPIFDAGVADFVDSNHVVGDGISFESTPGHTPGHISVNIESNGEKAVISGDMMHHPCQIAKPEWVTPFDSDSDAALETRKAFLEKYADQPVLILGTHFANPVAGRIVRDGDTYRFNV